MADNNALGKAALYLPIIITSLLHLAPVAIMTVLLLSCNSQPFPFLLSISTASAFSADTGCADLPPSDDIHAGYASVCVKRYFSLCGGGYHTGWLCGTYSVQSVASGALSEVQQWRHSSSLKTAAGVLIGADVCLVFVAIGLLLWPAVCKWMGKERQRPNFNDVISLNRPLILVDCVAVLLAFVGAGTQEWAVRTEVTRLRILEVPGLFIEAHVGDQALAFAWAAAALSLCSLAAHFALGAWLALRNRKDHVSGHAIVKLQDSRLRHRSLERRLESQEILLNDILRYFTATPLPTSEEARQRLHILEQHLEEHSGAIRIIQNLLSAEQDGNTPLIHGLEEHQRTVADVVRHAKEQPSGAQVALQTWCQRIRRLQEEDQGLRAQIAALRAEVQRPGPGASANPTNRWEQTRTASSRNSVPRSTR